MHLPHTRYTQQIQRLIDAVLDTSGKTDTALRHEVEARSITLNLHHPSEHQAIPEELIPYVDKVAISAYKITDEDIQALHLKGYSDDEIFEITISTALGAGIIRLERGLSSMKGENNAPQTA